VQPTTVYLRGDGNSSSGLGHIHRLLALSEMLSSQYNCKFVTRNPLPGVRSLIQQTCSEIIEVSADNIEVECSEFVECLDGSEIVVLDGYLFGTEYQQAIKKKSNTLVCIDDIHNYHFVADTIINPAGGTSPFLYSKEDYTELYVGPQYALLKKPFLQSREDRGDTSSVFICMGGADPENFTSKVLEVALQEAFDTYFVIVGEAFLHRKGLLQQIKNSSKKIQLLSNVIPNELADLMGKCSIGITSASNVAYEYASINGELYILKTADNQELLYEYLIDKKLAFPFIDFKRKKHITEIQALIEKQKAVFDRKSSKRINRIFNRLDLHKNVVIRKAAPSDLLFFFNWANDPELRRQSYNTGNITLAEHRTWFEKKIQDSHCVMLVFEYKNTPIAQVRFDIGETAVVSYSLDKDYRGRGWGESILQKGLDYLLNDLGPLTVVGYVKIKNEGSNSIFKNLGFTQNISNEYPESYRYELRKEK
jgi:UDP-2,4-diacetamido-2,4,6-trideoxy-beta-L-altropyranose hydrolase